MLVRNAPTEGDEFTVEAVFTAESVDAAAAVRTIASRWSGEKSSLEAHGWSLGLTGRKSAHKPLNLIMQLVGEDENMNTHVRSRAVRDYPEAEYALSRGGESFVCRGHRDVYRPGTWQRSEAKRRTATVKHSIVGKLGTGQATPVIGGIFRRSPHQFDGQIEASAHCLRIACRRSALSGDAASWSADRNRGVERETG